MDLLPILESEVGVKDSSDVDTTESLVFQNETSIQQSNDNIVNVSNDTKITTNDDMIKLETSNVDIEKSVKDIDQLENMNDYEEVLNKVDFEVEATDTDLNIPVEGNDTLDIIEQNVENHTKITDVNMEESENEGRENRMEIHDYGPIDRSLKYVFL